MLILDFFCFYMANLDLSRNVFQEVCLSFKAWVILLICLPVGDRKITYGVLSHTMLISLLSHLVLITQDDRSMQPCLAEHFTLAAFCYLLLAPLLHSLAFHLSFISFNHVHSTICFLSVFSFANTIEEAIYLSSRGQCVAPWFNSVCLSMCVHGRGITALAKMLSITSLERDLWLAAGRAILGSNSARGELTLLLNTPMASQCYNQGLFLSPSLATHILL